MQPTTGSNPTHARPPHPNAQQKDPQTSQPAAEGGAFLAGYNETKRYSVLNLIGKGSYGVVCAAKDNLTGEMVAIKKIQNVFDNVADAHRILREITLLRLLKHPDVVEIKHIMLPSDPNTFKDLYVVFELMESDLHTVIGANDDLTRDHHKVFLYQLLRGLNFMHLNGVLHRDLKPKNILANSNCKLKICDFGLARPNTGVAGASPLTPVLWTDYVATRWYRAPELCGCFYGRYTSAVDMWSIGCIFAEVLLGKPLFPGRDAVSQLQLITDLLGKPSHSFIEGVANVRARRFLQALPPKEPRPLESKFPSADPLALDLLARLLSIDPQERPTAADALAHPYFAGLPNAVQQESVPIAANFDFEACRLSEVDVRHLIYREAMQYHPHVLVAYEAQLAAMRGAHEAAAAVEACRTNPYTLASTPSDSVSVQFMLRQSDSMDSGCSHEPEPCCAPPMQQPSMQQLQAQQQQGPSSASQLWRYPAGGGVGLGQHRCAQQQQQQPLMQQQVPLQPVQPPPPQQQQQLHPAIHQQQQPMQHHPQYAQPPYPYAAQQQMPAAQLSHHLQAPMHGHHHASLPPPPQHPPYCGTSAIGVAAAAPRGFYGQPPPPPQQVQQRTTPKFSAGVGHGATAYGSTGEPFYLPTY